MTNQLKVIFRTDEDGETFALFPTEPGSTGKPWECAGYFVGQHFSGDFGRCINRSRPATPEEYGPLLEELRGIYERPDDPERVELIVVRLAHDV